MIRDPIAFRLAVSRLALFGAFLLLELAKRSTPDLEARP